MKNQQPVGEWILAGNREWFQRNGVIKIINDKDFEVIDYKKLQQWANCVNDWAIGQISTFYNKTNYIGSFLHLDESNIHIHFNFFRHKLKWNEKEQKMRYSFTHQGFLSPEKMKTLHYSYLKYQNKVLFKELNWEISLTPNFIKKNYIPLEEYKKEQLYQKRIRHLEQELSNEKSNKIGFNKELANEARQMLFEGKKNRDEELIFQAKAKMIQAGVEDWQIEHDEMMIENAIDLRS